MQVIECLRHKEIGDYRLSLYLQYNRIFNHKIGAEVMRKYDALVKHFILMFAVVCDTGPVKFYLEGVLINDF
jgi:hypothetical protein